MGILPKHRTRPLVNGERMTQPEFHRRYEVCLEDEKWELIGGIVYMASPLSLGHSNYDGKVGLVLELYEAATPGTQVTHNATAILDEESEPQPDLGLRILPDYGGQSRTTDDDYLEGAPELLVEVAHSRRDLAMHRKRDDYERTGVLEYLVVCMEEEEVHWFHFPSGGVIRPNRQGISRSRVFPGLWLDEAALLHLDSARLMEVLQQGLASRAHAAFVKRLQAAHRRHS
ncbi:MAG TPA: Uma2 family endonuclease [Gemmataceae bacterium]|nr:Uma2 family endonuclease [Gemmataceae bacterium]